MSLKSHDKKFRVFWLVGFSVIFLASIAFLWFISHRNNAQKSVLERIPIDADIGVIHLISQVNNIKNTKKLLSIETDDSSKSFLNYLLKNNLQGVDLLVDPIFFRYAGSPDFKLVLKLANKTNFELWLKEKPGNKWPCTILQKDNYSICTFQNLTFSVLYDADYLVVVFNQDNAISEADKFFNPTIQFDAKRILPKAEKSHELVTLSIQTNQPLFIKNSSIPLHKGIVRLMLTENMIQIQSDEFRPKNVMNNSAQWRINHQNINSSWNKVIRDYWNIKTELNPILDGIWHFTWKGVKKHELVFISYEFDDNFNRIEKKKVVEESLPDIVLQIQFTRPTQSDSLYNHLKDHDQIRENEVQIGPYWYHLSNNNTVWHIGSKDEMSNFEGNSTFLNVHVSDLKGDLESLSIPYQTLDSVLHNNLKTIDMQNDNGDYLLTIMVAEDCPYHILPILARLNRAKFD